MSLFDLDLACTGEAPPTDILAFLREAERRIDHFKSRKTTSPPGRTDVTLSTSMSGSVIW